MTRSSKPERRRAARGPAIERRAADRVEPGHDPRHRIAKSRRSGRRRRPAPTRPTAGGPTASANLGQIIAGEVADLADRERHALARQRVEQRVRRSPSPPDRRIPTARGRRGCRRYSQPRLRRLGQGAGQRDRPVGMAAGALNRRSRADRLPSGRDLAEEGAIPVSVVTFQTRTVIAAASVFLQ